MDVHLGASLGKVDHLHVLVRDGHGPDGPVVVVIDGLAETGVKVVNLRGAVDKVKLTLIDVESDEGEGAIVKLIVHSPVDALHEALVYVPEEGIAVPVLAGTGNAD